MQMFYENLQIFGKGGIWMFGNAGGIVQYDKDYMKIKFESNDNFVNMPQVTIIIRSIFAQNGKFYPQLFLDDALYEL